MSKSIIFYIFLRRPLRLLQFRPGPSYELASDFPWSTLLMAFLKSNFRQSGPLQLLSFIC
jgi:hypothetical protein